MNTVENSTLSRLATIPPRLLAPGVNVVAALLKQGAKTSGDLLLALAVSVSLFEESPSPSSTSSITPSVSVSSTSTPTPSMTPAPLPSPSTPVPWSASGWVYVDTADVSTQDWTTAAFPTTATPWKSGVQHVRGACGSEICVTQPACSDSRFVYLHAGTAPLGFAVPGVTYKTTLASGSATARTPTYYLRKSFSLATIPAGTAYSGTVSLQMDDGVVVFLNGVEVGRINVAEGPVLHTAYASAAVSTAADSTTVRTLSVAPGVLRAGANVLAVVLKQANPTSLDLLLDASVAVFVNVAAPPPLAL